MAYLIPGLAISGMIGMAGIFMWQFAGKDIWGSSEIFILSETTEYKSDIEAADNSQPEEYFCSVKSDSPENCSIYKFKTLENIHTTIAKKLTEVNNVDDKLLWSEMNTTKNKYVVLKINLATFKQFESNYVQTIKIKPKWSKDEKNFGTLKPILVIKDEGIESNIKIQHALVRVIRVSDSSKASVVAKPSGNLIVSGNGGSSNNIVVQQPQAVVSAPPAEAAPSPAAPVTSASIQPQQENIEVAVSSSSSPIIKAQDDSVPADQNVPTTKVTLTTGKYKCYFSSNFDDTPEIECKIYKFNVDGSETSSFDGQLTESTDIEENNYYLVDFGKEYLISDLQSKTMVYIKSPDTESPTITVSLQLQEAASLLTFTDSETPTTTTHIISIPIK